VWKSNRPKLSPKTKRAVRRLQRVAALSRTLPSKFWMDRYLRTVYRLYLRWSRRGLAESKTNQIAAVRNIRLNKRIHPIAILLAATCHIAEKKLLSRWTRALQFAVFREIGPDDLQAFIRANGGLSGCARMMAKFEPKRRRNRRAVVNISAAFPHGESSETDEDHDAPARPEIFRKSFHSELLARRAFRRRIKGRLPGKEDSSCSTKSFDRSRTSTW
jgi:hypothetical protein